MILKRLSVPLAGLCLSFALASCGAVSGFTSDHWPHWAGGLPEGAPPRPGTPGYDDYIAHRQADAAPAKPAAGDAQANAPAAPAPALVEPQTEDDPTVARGGLY